MRYVVTGAAGFIGSHLLHELLDRGHDAVGWDAFTDYYAPTLKEQNADGLPVERIDLAQDQIPDLDGFDGVFHLAGQPGVSSFGDVFPVYVRQNVVATQRLLEAAVASRTRVLFASSSSVYGDAESYPTSEDTRLRPLSPYGVTKLACEHLLGSYGTEFGLDAVILRYFTIYGPRQRPDMALARWIALVGRGESLELQGDGTQSRSFTYVDDAVDATIRAQERAGAGAVLNVGGGEEVSMLAAVEALEQVSGRSLELVHVPRRKGDQPRSLADTSRVRAEIGWEPTTRFADGLEAQWRWAADRVAAR